mgnify:FL=1|jgi:hypothetical protein
MKVQKKRILSLLLCALMALNLLPAAWAEEGNSGASAEHGATGEISIPGVSGGMTITDEARLDTGEGEIEGSSSEMGAAMAPAAAEYTVMLAENAELELIPGTPPELDSGPYYAKLSLRADAPASCRLPETIAVTMGAITLTADSDYTYDGKTGEVVITATRTDNVSITATAGSKAATVAPKVATAASGAAPNGYVEKITMARSPATSDQLYILSDKLPYEEFGFNQATTEYNIMFADSEKDKASQVVQFAAEPAVSIDAEIYGMITDTDDGRLTPEKKFAAEGYTSPGAQFKLKDKAPMNGTPYGIVFWTGLQDDIRARKNSDTYTFNFYRRATLKSFTVDYKDGGSLVDLTANANPQKVPKETEFDLYETNFEITSVTPGAILTITAPACTQADTTLKFDNGSGVFTAGETDTTYMLDLANYNKEKYKKDDGLIIPFVLDYAGNDNGENVAGVDGHYTLTVKPEASAAKPIITAESAATVKVADLEAWEPSYSAVAADGITDATSGVTLTYFESDGTARLADWDDVKTYIGDAKTNSAFVIKFNLAGAEEVEMKVTVQAKTDEPDGYIKNITIKTIADNYIVFDDYDPEAFAYEVEMPLTSSGFSSVRGYYNMPVELDNPSQENINSLNITRSVETPDGTVIRPPKTTSFYKKAVFDVVANLYGEKEGVYGYYGILDDLDPGRYVLKIRVHEKGNPETGDEYVFNITLVPVIGILSATAEGKSLPITPQPHGQAVNETTFNKNYHTTVPGVAESITLKGDMLPYITGVKFFYKDKDESASFKNDGVKIELAQYEKDQQGAITIPFSIVFGEGAEAVKSDYTLTVTETEAADWQIIKHPEGGTYDKGDAAVLSVEISGESDDLTYQWQYARHLSDSQYINDITGETRPTFTAPTEVGGMRYYRCVVTDKKTGAYVNSDFAKVVVNLGKVNAPVIVYQPGIYSIAGSSKPTPYKTEYLQGEKIDPIQMVAGTYEADPNIVRGGLAKVEVEWYYNTKPSADGATLLDSANYSAPISGGGYNLDDAVGNYVAATVFNYAVTEKLAAGEHYFYCVASAVANDDPTNRTSVASDFAKITIKERTGLDGFEGKGSEDNPYLIETADHLKKIDEYVLGGDFLSGAVFKFDNDITLPLEWEPIGKDNGGKGINLLPFSGIIDGGGHTLTVPKGGKPLLEYTRDAVVRNLNIYGEEINGAGLLDKVTVDYGTDGVYQQYTDPDVITMENVTLLSGSKTSGSGLANGGFNSGINDIIVKNCIIQENVTVGYDKDQSDIGSFVGTLNGRIENSVSYATVYGVRNVGGLAGKKGQSMGDCEIVNSAFLGTIEATGGNVGGILASGYISDSAPNTPPVTVRNCYVAADIIGNSTPLYFSNGYGAGGGIGGIAGSEIGLRGALNDAHISDNYFYGTITDTNPDAGTKYARVGGILGEIGCYDPLKLTYENNYYLENDNYEGIGYQLIPEKDWKPDEDSFIPKLSEEFADGTVTALLNNGSFKNWMQGQGGYPVHDPSAEPKIYALKISGDYKIIYYVGEKLDTTGMKLTALYTITGDKVEVDLKDAEFSGYDPNIVGNQDVTVTYGGASAAFTVSVIRKYDPGDPIGDTISVKFALIGSTRSDGDIDLGDKSTLYRGASYVRWIGLTEYEMAKGATVLELFDRALKEAGIPYTIRSMNNYVDSIKGLAEFTNGPRSGWMYTVGKRDNGSDGSHPNLGLREYVLSDGEVIIWHYVNDYSYEVHDWFDEPGYPSLGDGTYYNSWLKALASGSYTPPSGGGASEAKYETIAPKVTAKDGIAAVSVTADELSKAIAGVKKNGGTAIVIAPEITGTAKKVTVDIPKSSLDSMSSDTKADLKIVTPNGSVTIPNDALASVVSQASGNTITIAVESVEAKSLTAEQQKLVGDNAVFDISILSGGKPIGSFGGKSVTVSLPYTLKTGETSEGVTVWYLNDNGELEKVDSKYDKETGLATFTTTHLSSYVVGYAEESVWENPFTDVKDGDWFYEAVEFVVKNGLFIGTGDTAFSPDTSMTRAMLVTVLYRLEGKPAVTGTNSFTDVEDGEWYTDAVIWANANSIVTGYGEGLFGTNDPITREQLAVILYNYAKHKGYDVTKTASLESYTDASDISGWAADAMKWANVEGIIIGRTASTLDSGGNATRAEVAAIMQRFVLNFVN